jgi:negative regulator of sigma-B (phosphoserine phosphatase)
MQKRHESKLPAVRRRKGRVQKQSAPSLEWGVAMQTAPGQAVSGDAYVVKFIPRGALVAAVDGVGDPDRAFIAARTAVAILKKYAKDSVISLMKRCHRSLLMTRGAAITLASFDTVSSEMAWLGVGNVQAVLLRPQAEGTHKRKRLPLHSGVVGYHVPILHEERVRMESGETLVLATDGIRSDFATDLNPAEPPPALAAGVMARSFQGNDDAVVLVARYVRRNHEEQRE